MALPAYSSVAMQRTESEVNLRLSSTQPYPPVPFELRNHVSNDDWAVRVPAITRIASQYSKPMLERIWLLFSILSIIILPVALFQIIEGQMRQAAFENFQDEAFAEFQAHAISLGIFVGIGLLFFMPMAIWKTIGRRRVNGLIQRWAHLDRQVKGPSVEIPAWRVRTPGVFRDGIILSISLPVDMPPTSFHPNAYLPSFINGPKDAEANLYYPFKDEKGSSRMSVGSLPIYSDEKRAFHDVPV